MSGDALSAGGDAVGAIGPREVVGAVTAFARALRSAGVAADRGRVATALEGLRHVDPARTDDVYWALRLTLCGEPDDLPKFDALFDIWFRGRPAPVPARPRPARAATATQLRALSSDARGEERQQDDDVLKAAASEIEVLRAHDIGALTAEERNEVNRMIALLAPRVGTRRTLRMARRGHERIDVGRTVRQLLRDGGEPGALRYHSRRVKPRRLVLLLDVSGSMSPYADPLLRFAHAAVRVAPLTTEVFTIGTRLTRVTRQLRLRDPDLALAAAGAAVPDWSGGTRIGEALRAFLDLWGQRGTARRAIVVIASDGWERGDATLLGAQMQRLARLAHTVVWVNPHKGKAGFAPSTAGMTAALPFLDELIAGHSYTALRNLAEVIAHA
jgi:uncharacterized protein with von Willebrand factor type A (vWA) domain